MTEAGWTVCVECGMLCEAVEYHPFAACLMFKQCRDSATVRANLLAVRDDTYQQGRVAGVQDVLESFKKHHDACNDFRHCECAGGFWYEHIGKAWMDEKAAQAAQDEKGVGDGNSTKV